jgi:hypothetical protein
MWINIISVGRRVLFGGHLRLESSCFWINMVLTAFLHIIFQLPPRNYSTGSYLMLYLFLTPNHYINYRTVFVELHLKEIPCIKGKKCLRLYHAS